MARQVPADSVVKPVVPGLLFTEADLMTYQQAEKNSEDTTTLFIANSAIHTQNKKAVTMSMELMFEVNTAGGRILVRIPATWIPIDITTQVDRKTLLATPEFRRFTLEKKILIVKNDVAEKVLRTPEAREEYAKLQAKSSAQKNDDYYDILSSAQDGSLRMQPVEDSSSPVKNRANQFTGRPTGVTNKLNGRDDYSAQPTILGSDNPDVRSDIAAITAGQFSDATVIAIVSAHQNTLSLEECNYLIKNVQNDTVLNIAYARLGQIAQSRG